MNNDKYKPELPHEIIIVGFVIDDEKIVIQTLEPITRVVPFAIGRYHEPLSNREIDVIMLVAEGYRTPEIAEMLSLSPRTVESHRCNIRKKLNIKATHEMVSYVKTHLMRDDVIKEVKNKILESEM